MIIIHHNDPDGLLAGAIAYVYLLGDPQDNYPIKTILSNYSEKISFEEIKENEYIIIVDYSLQPEELLEIYKTKTKNIVWIDHHKTAIEKYENFPYQISGKREIGKSGCLLTWEYFYKDKQYPTCIKYINDWDIWKHEFPETKAYIFAVNCLPRNPKNQKWIELLSNENLTQQLLIKGNAILEYNTSKNASIMKSLSYEREWNGLKCLIANCTEKSSITFEQKDNGKYDLFVVWTYNGQNYTFSFYTPKNKNTDAGQLAKNFGGGGHKDAAGFISKENLFL